MHEPTACRWIPWRPRAGRRPGRSGGAVRRRPRSAEPSRWCAPLPSTMPPSRAAAPLAARSNGPGDDRAGHEGADEAASAAMAGRCTREVGMLVVIVPSLGSYRDAVYRYAIYIPKQPLSRGRWQSRRARSSPSTARTVAPASRTGTIRGDDRDTPLGSRRRLPVVRDGRRLPAVAALPAGLPSVSDLFDFMRDAELRFATLRMRIVERDATAPRRGRDRSSDVLLRHPGDARVTTSRPGEVARRDYEIWISDGDLVRTYAAAHRSARSDRSATGRAASSDRDFPGTSQGLRAGDRAPDRDAARHVRPPGRLLPERARDGPLPLTGTDDRRRPRGDPPELRPSAHDRARRATGPTTTLELAVDREHRRHPAPGRDHRRRDDARRRGDRAGPGCAAARRPPSTSSSPPGRRCSTDRSRSVRPALSGRPRRVSSGHRVGPGRPGRRPAPASDPGGKEGQRPTACTASGHGRAGGQPAPSLRSTHIPAFARGAPRAGRCRRRRRPGGRPSVPGDRRPQTDGSVRVREVSDDPGSSAKTSSSRTSPTCTSSATRRSCSARWAGSATSRSASASSAS